MPESFDKFKDETLLVELRKRLGKYGSSAFKDRLAASIKASDDLARLLPDTEQVVTPTQVGLRANFNWDVADSHLYWWRVEGLCQTATCATSTFNANDARCGGGNDGLGVCAITLSIEDLPNVQPTPDDLHVRISGHTLTYKVVAGTIQLFSRGSGNLVVEYMDDNPASLCFHSIRPRVNGVLVPWGSGATELHDTRFAGKQKDFIHLENGDRLQIYLTITGGDSTVVGQPCQAGNHDDRANRCQWFVEDNCRNNFKVGVYSAGQKFLTTVAARNVSEVCQKLFEKTSLNYPIIWPIKSIHRYSRPIYLDDIREDEARGIDHSCNELIAEDFEEVPDCLDFVMRQATHVQMGMSVTLQEAFDEYDATGGIQVAGSADATSNPNPGVLSIFGLAGDLGTFTAEMGVNVTVAGLESKRPSTHFVDSPLEYIGQTTVSVECGCNPLPVVLLLTHNLGTAGVLPEFLRRNGLSLPASFEIRYGGADTSYGWKRNFHFVGNGTSGHPEVWDCFFEWACTTDVAGFTYPSSSWKLSMLVRQRNTGTGDDYTTRLLYTFGRNEECESADFEFDFLVNTLSGISTPPDRIVSDVMVFHDDIGLFGSRTWTSKPQFKVRISEISDVSASNIIDISSLFPATEIGF
jgi:hypothetical protein